MTLLAPSIAAVLVALIAGWSFRSWSLSLSSSAEWAVELEKTVATLAQRLAELKAEQDRLGDKVAAELSRRRPTGT